MTKLEERIRRLFRIKPTRYKVITLDIPRMILVLLVLSLLAGGSWFIHSKKDLFRDMIPDVSVKTTRPVSLERPCVPVGDNDTSPKEGKVVSVEQALQRHEFAKKHQTQSKVFYKWMGIHMACARTPQYPDDRHQYCLCLTRTDNTVRLIQCRRVPERYIFGDLE